MSTTKYKIAVMKAHCDGATIEHRSVLLRGEEYKISPNPSWNWAHTDYRIKQAERKTVKLLAYYDGVYLFWKAESEVNCGLTRVPAEDKTIEIE